VSVRRSVPDITTSSLETSSAFYRLLGFEEVMNLGWVVTLASPANPAVQVTLMSRDASAEVDPDLSIEVEDVDAAHSAVVASGAQVVHSLRDEDWGVRRFFVRDPSGKIVNVVGHRP
jgi:catechol 2,3-dioxygenase-like lactoylglutathione lyase family enzyme